MGYTSLGNNLDTAWGEQKNAFADALLVTVDRIGATCYKIHSPLCLVRIHYI
jgi:hypothetical protein